ncbi:TraR/DksA C4-type zinc finger protein [Candidatus Roizmanbacteria bacterium]|nr:MAG: TraR/DksA C4-type zinc finger protein [Candidatus Roizmanbacteria bacterium]
MSRKEDIKKTLLAEKESILKRMEDLRAADPFSDPDHVDDNAAVDTDVREQESHQRIEAELETLEKRLENIKIALEQNENGMYGVCKRCNKDIPPKRLQLIPESIYCVNCEAELTK